MSDDDELYEQFQYEMEHGTPHPNVVDPRELEQLLQQLEDEQEQVFLRRNVPVSYTHLDVYKRQPRVLLELNYCRSSKT